MHVYLGGLVSYKIRGLQDKGIVPLPIRTLEGVFHDIT